ncbi:transglycosylase domain-containing protein [Eubacterium oxidoreducens]|uniref:Penicillin-binding protein 1A n=1 Tax=Eubacterium oxidoreducens TaxID=1732 RepID=A0A1G6CD13_EUBOX|nr:PBP1A family penicillin-binding protein [Eubacterium oxidoreducens]SDB30733.1 penicillin-binding protein 1A [Eubacterium oxidoreducens]
MNYGKKHAQEKQTKIKSKKTKKKKKFVVVFGKTLLICILAVLAVGAVTGYKVVSDIIAEAPDIEDIDASPTGYLSTVYDSENNEIATLVASGSNRVYVTIDEIPEDMQHAFVAIEDERFYEHNGVDLRGIARALFKGIKSGFTKTEGASTITQQLLKNNVFTDWTSESTMKEKITRKIQEQYLAIQLEKEYSKEWILENYLNTINLGQNCLGVQAASERYFGKDVSELTLSEAAVIAGITKNPVKYNPISNPDENAQRRELVLGNMLEQGYIDQSEYDEAMADDVYERIQVVNAQVEESEDEDVYSYFVDELTEQVIEDLQEKLGYSETQAYKALYNGGLSIYSTQDPDIQEICDEEVSDPDNYAVGTEYSFSYALTIEKEDGTIENYDENTMLSYYQSEDPDYDIVFSSEEECKEAVEKYKNAVMEEGDEVVENGEVFSLILEPQAAMTIMDQSTGEVKALVGGRGEKTASKTLNRATDTTRQPGSTFKVLAAYAPALDAGGMTLATVQDDAPYTYSNGTKVNNYDNTYRGFTTIRQAITNSINVVTVKTLTDITPQVGYDYLLNFGFTTLTDSDIVQALALGGITNGVTNLELTAAYATIANGGTYTEPIFYTKILDHDGNVLIDNTPETHTVLKETTAFLLTSAMEDVMTKGTGTTANFSGMATAGKSGTTTKNRDALFAGYTPYYTCVVWGGYDDNSQLSSTAYPKVLWKNVMSRIHEDLEEKEFEVPDGIVQAKVCKKSGKLAISGVCSNDQRGSMVETEYFEEGTEPTAKCDHHVSITVCSESGQLATDYCPETTTKVYITGGSSSSQDGKYMLSSEDNVKCTIHTKESKKKKKTDSEDEDDSSSTTIQGDTSSGSSDDTTSQDDAIKPDETTGETEEEDTNTE